MNVFEMSVFWDEACWFLSFRVFGILSSSLLLFPQCFGQYVLRPSSGVCQTREPSRNFELCPLLNPRGLPVLIPLAITGCKCQVFLYCYLPVVRIESTTFRWLKLREPTPISVTPCILLDNSEWILGIYILNVFTWLELLLLCMIFYLCSYSDFFFFFFFFNYYH